MPKVLIIGGGFAGCAAADLISQLEGTEVDLIEGSSYLGAGNKTRWYGGHPYTFGPRHFLTPYEEVFQYLDEIIKINLCPEHEFLSYVESDNNFYAYPINMEDVRNMPEYSTIKKELQISSRDKVNGAVEASNLEEYWIKSVGSTLYNKMIKNYNKKMWLVDDVKKIDTFKWSPKGVTIKEGPRAAWDNVFSGYPYAKNGYDDYFPYATRNASVYLNTKLTKIDMVKKEIEIGGGTRRYDIIVNTIAPETLYEKQLGDLPYLGRKLDLIVFPTEHVFPGNVYFLYYTGNESFTRLVEYKKFTKHEDRHSLIGMETPVNNGGKDYPMPFRWAQKKAREYHKMMKEDVYSIGRAGSYLYGIDIDDCIRQAMMIKERIKSKSWDYPVPGEQYQFPELDK